MRALPLTGRPAALAVAAFALAAFFFVSHRSPSVPYLAAHGPATWVVYPSPRSGEPRPNVRVEAEFTRRFELGAVPSTAPLRVQAFRDATVRVNGTALPLDGSGTWRVERHADAARLLRAGSNTIEVSVANRNARPALWLALELPQGALVTDGRWEASWGGAKPVPAAPAASVPPAAAIDPGVPSPIGGFLRELPLLLLLAFVAFGIVFGFEKLQPRIAGREFELALGLVTLLWLALLLHNSPLLHPTYGFDASEHLAYIDHIRTTGSLPLANEGWQMYQPPLYYGIIAAVLTVVGQPADGPVGIFVVRVLGAALAVANVALLLVLLRALFPARPRLHAAGLLLIAFLPLQLYLYQYPTNETLAATLALAALAVAIRIVRDASPGVKAHALLGLALGGALLTRFTTLLVVLPIVAGLAFAAATSAEARRTRWRGLAVALAVALAVCGWHYARVTLHYGQPLVGNWDGGFGKWWQDSGYRTAQEYTRFGEALVAPLYSAAGSVWDALYATLWGDALYGGMSTPRLRPPWNDALLGAGTLLALLPTLAILLGAAWGLGRVTRAPRAPSVILGGAAALGFAALVAFTLKTPAYAQVKVFYALPAVLAPVIVAGAIGIESAAGTSRWRQRAVFTALVLFAMVSYATYWIDGSRARAWAAIPDVASAAGATKHDASEVRTTLALDPRDHAAWSGLAARGGAVPARTLVALARVAKLEEQPSRAEELLGRAIATNPDDLEAWRLRAELHTAKDPAAAVRDLQELLRIEPYDLKAHEALVPLLLSLGDREGSERHAAWADRIAKAKQ